MAIELGGGCRTFGLREGDPIRRGGLRVWRHVGRETGARAISLSTLEIESGASTQWRNGPSDELLFVVEGEGTLRLEREHHGVGPLAGVLVRPGERIAIENSGRAPLTLLESRCPDSGPDLRFEAGEPAFPSGSVPRRPCPVVRFEGQPTERAGDGRWFRVLVDAKTGSAEATQFIGFIPPGRAPDHFHEYEEVICILEGQGRFRSGGTSAPASAGSCLYLPRRRPHCLENTGEAPLSLYGLFSPSGSPAVRYDPAGISDRR